MTIGPHMLTAKQRQMLDWIIQYQKENRLSPSMEEIRVGMNIVSISNVWSRLATLEKRGFITRRKYTARGIHVNDIARVA